MVQRLCRGDVHQVGSGATPEGSATGGEDEPPHLVAAARAQCLRQGGMFPESTGTI